ncbi:fimbrin-2 [Anaeramoeba flamelloides]|uniref:Fimbrin-2 n=1 Tax=Anaeramoeba flamelloides TaxID=1746091 RepID=A0AAV8A2L0_9EUKA|nr:fimbrin-2 [Anaeramoeba flamelloides]
MTHYKSLNRIKKKQKPKRRTRTKKSKVKPLRRRNRTLHNSTLDSRGIQKKLATITKQPNEKELSIMMQGLAKTSKEERVNRKTMSLKGNDPIIMMKKGDMEGLAQLIETLYKEIDIREDECREVAKAGLRVTKNNASLKIKITELEEALKESMEENESLSKENVDLETNLKDFHKKNDYMREKVEEAWESNQMYLEELKRSDEEMQKIKNMVGKESKLLEKNRLLENEIKDLEYVQQENQTLISRDKKNKEATTQYKKSISDLRTQNNNLGNDITSLKRKLEKYIEQKNKTKEKDKKINQLEQDNNDLRIHLSWYEKITLQNTETVGGIFKLLEWFGSERSSFDPNSESALIFKDTKKVLNSIQEKLDQSFKKKKSKKHKSKNKDKNTSKSNENVTSNSIIDLDMFKLDLDSVGQDLENTRESEDKRRLVYLSLIIFYHYRTLILEKQEKELSHIISDLKTEISELKRKLKQERERRKSIEGLFEQYKKSNNNKKVNSEEMSKLKRKLEQEIKKASRREKELINLMEKSKEKLEKGYLKKLHEQKKAFAKEMDELKAKDQKMIKENLELKEGFERRIKKQKVFLKQEKENHKSELKKMKKKYETEIEELNNKYLGEIQDLQFQIEGNELEMEDCKNSKLKMKKTLNQKIDQLQDKLNKAGNDQQSRSKFQNDQMNTFKKQNEELQLQLEIEEQKRKRSESRRKDLEKKYRSAQSKLKQHSNEIRRLSEENSKLLILIKQLEEEINNLRQQLVEALNLNPIIIKKEKEEPIIEEMQSSRDIGVVEQMMTEFINNELKYDLDLNHLLPIGTNTPDLIDAMRDGLLLCKLINHCVPETIDERVVNVFDEIVMEKHMDEILENHTLCINSALAIGCSVKGITAKALVNEEENSCLQFCWEIIKQGLLSKISLLSHPELIELCQGSESLQDLTSIAPEDLLLRWVNSLIANSGYQKEKKNLTCQNFDKDLKDGLILGIILNQIDNQKCPLDSILESQEIETRADYLVSNAKNLGINYFICSESLIKSDPKLNLAFLSYLFDKKNGITTQKKIYNDSKIPDFGTREERSFRLWINSLGVKPKVYNLYEDLKDGNILAQVIEKVAPPNTVNWKKIKINCINMYEKILNCNYIVDLGKQLNLKLRTTGGRDIYDAKKVMVLGYVWQLMRYHVMAILKKLNVLKGLKIDDSSMVTWANTQVKNAKKSSKIRNFRDRKLRTGVFLIDLIYSINKKAVNYNFVTSGNNEEQQMNNARLIISLTRKLGGSIFLLPEDIAEVKDKMILTLVGEIMRINRLLKNKK